MHRCLPLLLDEVTQGIRMQGIHGRCQGTGGVWRSSVYWRQVRRGGAVGLTLVCAGHLARWAQAGFAQRWAGMAGWPWAQIGSRLHYAVGQNR
jgi:hypothetical protein